MLTRFNHAYDIAFQLEGSKCPQGTDVTKEMLMDALKDKLERVSSEGNWEEVFGAPFDTYEYTLDGKLIADSFLNVETLEELYGKDGDGEYPHDQLSRAAWRKAVACESTVSGYWQWVYETINSLVE